MAEGSVKPAGKLSIRVIRGKPSKPPKRRNLITALWRYLTWP